MGFDIDLTRAPVSRSATQIVYWGDEDSNERVALIGTGLTYNAQGVLNGGTITGMELRNGTTLQQSVSIPSASAATLYNNVLSKVAPLSAQINSWNLADANETAVPLISSSQIRVKLLDNTFLQVLGNIDLAANTGSGGTVTAIRHLAANGTTVLNSATGLPLPANLAFMALSSGEAVYDALVTGNNVLRGSTAAFFNSFDGGPGNDWLIGSASAHDTLNYEKATSAVVVNLTTGKATGGGGNDTFYFMDDVDGSSFNDTIIGNGLRNTLWGAAGSDTINGAAGDDFIDGDIGNDIINGGFGRDTLYGDAGFDTFVFNTAPNSNLNADTLHDFSPYWDTIQLENAVFTALGTATGQISAAMFHRSSTGLAHDADDRIIYNTSTGVLTYDTNGNAAGGIIQIATLFGAPNVTAADIVII